MRAELVSRPRLLARLEEALQGPLTLICAPAGFGKTTLIGEWIAQQRMPVAWLSLDQSDNDPVRFWMYVIAALQRFDPQLGQEAAAVLQAQATRSVALEPVLTLLVNDLLASSDHFVLILDDYHVIESRAIHDALELLLDHLPPAMHLVMTTRADPPLPLARMRVRAQLVEIRAADLRFSLEEATVFLNEVMRLELSADHVAALETRTEGWIAGLQLSALSLHGREDVSPFIEAVTGNDHYIVDYLVEEVLNSQPESVQNFLMQTSILDRLSAALCNAVTDRPDDQELLAYLDRANLFLIPLDDERSWYRYHHLFADVLRNRLRRTHPGQVGRLHGRASDWYERHGWLPEAIGHAFLMDDMQRAADLIERIVEAMLKRGESATLHAWLQRLPDTLVRARPRLCLAFAIVLSQLHQMEHAESYVRDAERVARAESGATALLSEIAAQRVSLALYNRDLPAVIELARQALASLPPDKLVLRGQVLMRLGLAYNWSGQIAEAERAYLEASRLSLEGGDIYTAVLSTSNYAGALSGRGDMRLAAATEQKAIDLAARAGVPNIPIVGAVYTQLAEYFYEWNKLDEAERHLMQAIEFTERDRNPRIQVLNYAALAHVLQAQGRAETALDYLHKAQQLAQGLDLPRRYTAPIDAFNIRRWLAQGDLQAALDWARGGGLSVADKDIHAGDEIYRLLARVLMAQGEMDRAVDLLTRLIEELRAADKRVGALVTQALLALALQKKGESARALIVLEEVLLAAEPQGYVRTFVDEGASMWALLRDLRPRLTDVRARDYIDALLSAFDVSAFSDAHIATASQTSLSTPVDALTARELEVLQLVAQGLSDREIAERLVVVAGTIKRHLNSIYSKLGVHSRTQALARAREQHLI
jgi:LuxR family maltose regulon positive regulatory protein